MLYNIDFTIAALVALAFLLLHYVRNGVSATNSSRTFLVFIIYTFIFGIVDIANVLVMSDPSASDTTRFVSCTICMCLEMGTTPLLMFYLPLAIVDITKEEFDWLRLILIPAFICILAMIFLNPIMGVFFTINPETKLYVPGYGAIIIVLVNALYILLGGIIAVRNRRRIDAYKTVDIWLILLIGTIAIFAQTALGTVRLTAFCYTIIILEMYLSYQIPERRIDTLTGLYTRHAFTDMTERMLARNADVPYVMVYTNIVEFKAINELYGYDAGDRILVGFAQYILTLVDGSGTAGRLQSDHFVFCVPEDRFDIDELLEGTCSSANKDRFGCDVNLVFGIYVSQGPHPSPSIMCDRARLAMDDIEWSRNNRYSLYNDERGEHFLSAHEISDAMDGALQDGQFEVYLQPIFRMEDTALVGSEALVRWIHPEKGQLKPDEFIPVFERTGQIAELDEFVWTTVCSHLRTWKDEGLPHVIVSMNISRADLRPDLCRMIVNLFDTHGVSPDFARFEITESAYIEHVDQLTRFIDELHADGFKVLLDDFGNGYSSLSVLQNAPFDIIKIDREFLAGVTTDERSRIVLETTLELAGKLGLPVITEGVETQEQADLLKKLGSTFAQGYLYGRPIPIADFERRYLRDAPNAAL